jgi:aminoglycoside 2'-N-acetyltransferase I
MTTPRLVHTAFLTQAERSAIRELLVTAFPEDFPENLEHVWGGVHATVWENEELLAHGCVIMRQFLHGTTALRTGYVEAVAVRADRRRQGLGDAVMASLEPVIRAAYEIGALSASDAGVPLYEQRGWLRWQGTASVITANGIEQTPGEEDCIFVLPATAQVDLNGDLACDWRTGEVW